MKKIILAIALALAAMSACRAAETNPDSIVGDYLISDEKRGETKVRFFRAADGTYSCQVLSFEKPIDPSTGKPWVDSKNPDKSLRGRRSDTIVLVSGLKYNADKDQWDGAKIYDPTRGIRANVTCKFDADGNLTVRGSVLGIGETHVWPKVK